jgi:hypothetical protein
LTFGMSRKTSARRLSAPPNMLKERVSLNFKPTNFQELLIQFCVHFVNLVFRWCPLPFGRYVVNTVLLRTHAKSTLISTVRVSVVRSTTSQNNAISTTIGSQFLIIRFICSVNCLGCSCRPCSDVIFPFISTVEGQQTRILCLSLFTGKPNTQGCPHFFAHSQTNALDRMLRYYAVWWYSFMSVRAHQYAVRTQTAETSIPIARLSYVEKNTPTVIQTCHMLHVFHVYYLFTPLTLEMDI